MVSALKLPVLKTREYDLWSMRMEQYLTFTDHDLWEVIVNGDLVSLVASASAGVEGPIPPKTAKQKLARKNELKAKSTLMLAIPEEHLLKFHTCKDEKFQKLISQIKIHGEVISQEDANLKLLRSLPSAWNNIALIMRNKSDLDTLSMDDLYNNLKVYESKIKGQSSSSSNSQNVAFVSSDNSSSTNETVNTAHNVCAASFKDQASTASYADDVMFSFFSNQSNAPKLDNEDLEQIDVDDLEEMDLKWQVVMLTMRVKRFIKKIGRKLDLNDKETVGFDMTKVECYNCHRRGHFAIEECRAPRNQGNRNRDAPRRNAPVYTSTTNALVVQDGIGKTGLGYDSQINESELNNIHKNKSEVIHSVFNNRESDVDDNLINDRFNPVNDRFKKIEGYHAVPPPYTGNYMPSRPDLFFAGLDNSVYKTKDTDSDNDSVFRPKSDQTKPKFTKINFFKSGENVKSVNKENTHSQVEYPRKSQSPRDNRRNSNGMMTQKLGNGFKFIKKACFVYGSFNHLIKDCDFHDNKMRVNHQYKLTHPHPKRNFVPTAVATKSGQVPVNAAKQSSPRVAASISTARPVNTAAPKSKVNDALPTTYSYFKAHSPLVLLREMGKMLLSPQHAGFGDQQEMLLTITPKTVDHTCLKDLTMLIYKADSSHGCSRHMTRNKSFLTDYQEIDDGFVAFRESLKGGKITGKDLCILILHSPSSSQSTIIKYANEVPRKENDYQKRKRALNKEDDQHVQDFRAELDNLLVSTEEGYANHTNRVSTNNPSISTTAGQAQINNTASPIPNDPSMQSLEATGIFDDAYDDRKTRKSLTGNSTTGGCHFLQKCYGSPKTMLDYGFNFMNTKIHIDNESTICIVKNPVFHSKTKHIEIRHHFIRDSYEKKLVQVIKIHTNHNVVDLLTNAFDVSSGPIYLVADETVYKEWEDRMKRAATTPSSLEAEQDSGSLTESDEGSMTLNELMVLCTTLSKKVETLESDLKQTKMTYGAAYTKLIMKVKKLEHKVKLSKARRRVRLVVSEDEDKLRSLIKQGRQYAQIDRRRGHYSVQIVTDSGES
ncbi:hypothetical protein Tco_1515814 [Tanacetum coccineum]